MTTNKTAIDALPRYNHTAFDMQPAKDGFFFRADQVLAALAPTVQEAEQGMAPWPAYGIVHDTLRGFTGEQLNAYGQACILADRARQSATPVAQDAAVQGSVGTANENGLLPCPFCGNQGDMVDQGTGSWRVACLQSKGGCGASSRMTFDKGATATADWNRRAALAQRASVAEVASLTPEQVIELLKYELIIDSGARFLLNGDSMSFSLEELTLFANHVRGTALTASTPPAHKPDELALYDEIECDLPYLFGRASKEGHETGQELAKQVQSKMQAARTLPRTNLAPMQSDDEELAGVVRQWYFDCDGHYIDVELDENGKYSILFKDRVTKEEAWLNQAMDTPPAPAEKGETASGYRAGTCTSAPDGSGKITLHYATAAQAEAAFQTISDQIDETLAAPAPSEPAPQDTDELHYNAQRLRNVCRLAGVIADGDDAFVDGARGALLGQVAAVLRKAEPAPQGVPEDPCPQCQPGGVCKTPACGRLRSSELMALYGTVAPAATSGGEAVAGWDAGGAWLTHLNQRKLANLHERGFKPVGTILCDEAGHIALFDSSCRWLTMPQYQRLMHEQDGSLFADHDAPQSLPAASDASAMQLCRDMIRMRDAELNEGGCDVLELARIESAIRALISKEE